mmetsp:Transcript_49640/g.112613  ORF Transcript_49640/g.112613 Transcript_49640/m.112613 type:complete len:202 (-) Transcript_49640:1091-1696(-)
MRMVPCFPHAQLHLQVRRLLHLLVRLWQHVVIPIVLPKLVHYTGVLRRLGQPQGYKHPSGLLEELRAPLPVPPVNVQSHITQQRSVALAVSRFGLLEIVLGVLVVLHDLSRSGVAIALAQVPEDSGIRPRLLQPCLLQDLLGLVQLFGHLIVVAQEAKVQGPALQEVRVFLRVVSVGLLKSHLSLRHQLSCLSENLVLLFE